MPQGRLFTIKLPKEVQNYEWLCYRDKKFDKAVWHTDECFRSDIHVKKGRIYGLLGRNGAGKTTTMKMLLGLTAPTSGEVEILGKNIRTNSKQVLPHIGSLIEAPGFYPNLTGTENLRIFAELRNIKNANAIKEHWSW